MTMAGTDVDARAEVRTSAALATGLVVVHLVMAYYVFSLSDAIFDLVIRLSGQELAEMMVTLAPAVPLALVVLFWARDRTLGWIACLVVVATALLPYVRNVVVERLYEAGELDAAVDLDRLVGLGARRPAARRRGARVGHRAAPGHLVVAGRARRRGRGRAPRPVRPRVVREMTPGCRR